MPGTFLKDPAAVLEYKFDWKPTTNGSEPSLPDWLASGETIASYTITPETGIVVDSDSLTDNSTSVTVWLSGGTHGVNYRITCHITTNSTPARQDERTMTVMVTQR